jgi:hypothetical protein
MIIVKRDYRIIRLRAEIVVLGVVSKLRRSFVQFQIQLLFILLHFSLFTISSFKPVGLISH